LCAEADELLLEQDADMESLQATIMQLHKQVKGLTDENDRLKQRITPAMVVKSNGLAPPTGAVEQIEQSNNGPPPAKIIASSQTAKPQPAVKSEYTKPPTINTTSNVQKTNTDDWNGMNHYEAIYETEIDRYRESNTASSQYSSGHKIQPNTGGRNMPQMRTIDRNLRKMASGKRTHS
jgi:hypothetical protein